MQKLTDCFTLKGGAKIPCIGFGTWQAKDDAAVNAAVEAMKLGYRHIDTAGFYFNEESVGEAIRSSGIAREDLFITSKVWNTERGYEKTMAAFQKTLEDLGLDYLDMYLIHWPAAKGEPQEWQAQNLDTWRALEKLYQDGKIKAIGVSNFMPHHLKPLMDGAQIMPMVNQIEYHPGYLQEETVSFCKENGILVEAWAPLGTGRVLKDQTLQKIAEKYGRSVAQICVRFCLQNGVLPLPKSVTPSRIEENAQVFDFEITQEDMEMIASMPETGWSGLHPDRVDF